MRGAERALAVLASVAGLSVCAAAMTGCAPEAPALVVTVTPGARPLSDLARLTLVAQACGAATPAVERELTVANAQATTHDLEAPIAPGRAFWVWLQGWQGCVPAETGCVPAASAMAGECVCVGEGRTQILVSEACTPWVRAAEGSTAVRLTLGAPMGFCPPEPLEDCAKLP